MSEHVPSFSRPEPPVVGPVSDERKKELQRELAHNFENNRTQVPESRRLRLSLVEYPKQEYEKQIIADANLLLNDILIDAGVKPFDIPEDNIYIVPDKTYREVSLDSKDRSTVAVTRHRNQSIVLNAEKSGHPLSRAAALLHEMAHLKNFYSIEAPNEESDWYRRSGLGMRSTSQRDETIGEFHRFYGLNEAVVSELEKRLYPRLVEDNPVLKAEQSSLLASKEYLARREETAKREHIDEDDIIYISDDESDLDKFVYGEQRKVLNFIMDTIYRQHPDQFASEEDVFNLFLQAHFGGQLLPLTRAIKSTFGEDAFRVLGMMDESDTNSARNVMDYFQKKGGRVRKEQSSEPENHTETTESSEK